MTIIGLDMKVMGPLAQQAELEKERQEEMQRQKETRDKAAAYASVAKSLGVPVGRMTPAQRAFADSTARAWKMQGSVPRGYGFSIPTEGRRPNK